MWTFKACELPGGGRPIERFVESLGDEAENDLMAIVEALQHLERRFWTRPQFDILSGYDGMGEIRFNGDGNTYRVFGFFGPDRHEFTMVHGCEKKRDLKKDMDLAARRRRTIESGIGSAYEFTF
jgi:hypothetical protein